MSIEEGIKSFDPSVIKIARGAAKGQVTKNVTALKKLLECDSDGHFDTSAANKHRV